MMERSEIYRISKKAFDKSAEHYEKFYARSELNKRMRNIVWRYLSEIIKPGDMVLDLGCGTGIDAIFMSKLGADVIAIDISEKMIEKTMEKIKKLNLKDRVRTLVMGTGELHLLKDRFRFNIILSNFGPLNMEPELENTAKILYELLEDKGIMVANVINRYCLWEFAYFLFSLKFKDILRRLRTARLMILDEDVIAWAYSPAGFYKYFKNYFMVKKVIGLNILLPPPYMEKFYLRFRSIFKYLDKLEGKINYFPLIRACGDHFLIIMQKIHILIPDDLRYRL
jgi:ubiquinone/menaquinone biosynthesis C-methylase UbiE